MNIIEVVTKYLPTQVDKVFMADAKTAVLENGSKWIDVSFAETGYVKIANVLMDGLADYRTLNGSLGAATDYAHYAGQNGTDNRDGFHVGNAGVEWEIFKLQWKRGKEFQIDYIEDEEAAGALMANLMTEFVRTKVVPETDAVRFAEMYKKTSVALGNRAALGADLSDSNVIAALNAGYQWLTENQVPSEEQVIFCSPRVMTFIRNSEKLFKFLTQTDYKSAEGVTFKLQAYEGRPIIEVPSDRFFTEVSLTNNGYVAGTDAKVIDIMIVSKKAIVPIRKLEYNKIFKPGEIHGFYGYVADFLFYHGVVIPKNKVPGIYVITANNAVNASSFNRVLKPLLRPATSADGATPTGLTVLDEVYTTPTGLFGSIVQSVSAPSLGDAVVSSGSLVEGYEAVVKGSAFKPILNAGEDNTTFYLSMIDGSGKVIAVSSAITIADVVA